MARREVPWLAVVAIALLGVAAGTLWQLREPDRPEGSAPPRRAGVTFTNAALTAEECAKRIDCIGPKHAAAAGPPCRKAIENLAAYAPRWAQAGTDRLFRDQLWLEQARGTITFLGHDAEFQNAAGIWQPVAYECDYDPATQSVLEARVKGAAGR